MGSPRDRAPPVAQSERETCSPQVVTDLRELAREAREELGLGEDLDLEAAVAVFRAEWKPSPPPPIPGEPVLPGPCAHCGWEPLASTPPRQPPGDLIERLARSAFTGAAATAPGPAPAIDGPSPSPADTKLAIAWFPADEWPEAVRRWPHLLDEMPADHLAYSHAIEASAKAYAAARAGTSKSIAPLSADALADLGAEEGIDPGSGDARATVAARVRLEGRALAWPPGRNEPCWCGSGVKYKRCCGPTPPK